MMLKKEKTKPMDNHIKFEELKVSNTFYNKIETEKYFLFETNTKVSVIDTCFDKLNKQYIIATKVESEVEGIYNIDYVFLGEKFEIMKVLREEEGVNPKFIKSKDEKVWVQLSYLKLDNKMIILPIENRNEVDKVILKRNLGYDYLFRWENETYGYMTPIFEKKEIDKVFWIQFNKKNHYKGTKNIKLEFCSYGTPFIQNNKLYISSVLTSNMGITMKIFNLNTQFEVIYEWTSEIINDASMIHLVSVENELYKFIGYNTKNILYLFTFGVDGKLISKKSIIEISEVSEIFTLSTNINHIKNKLLLRYTSGEGNGIITIENNAIRELFSKNGEIKVNNNEIFKFNSRCYFTNLKCENNLKILVSPINSIENQENRWLILK